MKYRILNFKSSFYNSFNLLLLKNSNNIYNINNEIKLIDNFLNNKITIVNVYTYNSAEFLKSLLLTKYINGNYNNVGIFDVVIKNNNSTLEDIINSSENKMDFLVNNYDIRQPILYINESDLEKQKELKNAKNKLLILDELGNIKYMLNNDVSLEELKEKIETVAKQRRYLVAKNNIEIKKNNRDVDFIGSFKKIISIERDSRPLLVILDSKAKRILIITINGEIIYDITSKNFCLPSNIKYIDEKLYLSDMCDNSIKLIDLEKQNITTVVKDYGLLGITDFEFLDNGNILFVSSTKKGIEIFNGDRFISLEKQLNLDYKIGIISKIVKKNNRLYYLDTSHNILYSFDGENNRVVADLNDNPETMYGEIENFYINNENNIYFLDVKTNKIFHKLRDKIEADKFLNVFENPKDMTIFKNIIYLAEDKKIKAINLYKNNTTDLFLRFLKNRKIFFNVEENIDIKPDGLKKINGGVVKIQNLLDGIDILPNSPSFLVIFERKSKSELILNKVLFYNDLKDKIELESGSVIYGKIYYENENGIKIREIKWVVE